MKRRDILARVFSPALPEASISREIFIFLEYCALGLRMCGINMASATLMRRKNIVPREKVFEFLATGLRDGMHERMSWA